MRSSLDLLTKPEKPIGHLEEHVKEQEERIGKAVQAAREALEKQREVMKKGRPENARQSFAPEDSIFIKDFPPGLAKKLQPRQRARSPSWRRRAIRYTFSSDGVYGNNTRSMLTD